MDQESELDFNRGCLLGIIIAVIVIFALSLGSYLSNQYTKAKLRVNENPFMQEGKIYRCKEITHELN